MRILTYEFRSAPDRGMSFSQVSLQKLNLVVGDSASGKTRFLNTVFHCGMCAVQRRLFVGQWDLTIEQEGITYGWSLQVGRDSNHQAIVDLERLCIIEDGRETVVLDRGPTGFVFDGQGQAKLSRSETGLYLLRDEKLVEPVFRGFLAMVRRDFSSGELDKAGAFSNISQNLLREVGHRPDVSDLFGLPLGLSGKLYLLERHLPHVYERICTWFKATFPFVSAFQLMTGEDFDIHMPGVVPVFAVKESNVESWVPLAQFSSGMKKVLLILTDLFLLPPYGGVYLIDEYENSLGVNPINFLPSVLSEVNSNSQFIITSHHPYVINKIPVRNWYLIHRTGLDVTIEHGQRLEDRYGKSRQQAFIQLINDPHYYSRGIE